MRLLARAGKFGRMGEEFPENGERNGQFLKIRRLADVIGLTIFLHLACVPLFAWKYGVL